MNNKKFSMDKINKVSLTMKAKWEKSYWLMVILGFMAVGYIFFLSSSVWAASSKDLLFTPIRTTNTINKREITLARWDYSPNEKRMEIELSLNNKAVDGNNVYIYELADRSGNTYTLVPIIATPNLVVMQAEGIPGGFTELSFRVTPNIADAATLKLYTNKNSVNRVDTITIKTENEYYIGQIERTIGGYEAEKEIIDKNIESYNSQIEALKTANVQLEKDKAYQLAAQIVETDKNIAANNEQMKTLSGLINDGTARKTELDRLIKEARDKIEQIRAGQEVEEPQKSQEMEAVSNEIP